MPHYTTPATRTVPGSPSSASTLIVTIHELADGCDVGREVPRDFRGAVLAGVGAEDERQQELIRGVRVDGAAANRGTQWPRRPRRRRPTRPACRVRRARRRAAAPEPAGRSRPRRCRGSRLPILRSGCATRHPDSSAAYASRRACRLPTDSGSPAYALNPPAVVRSGQVVRLSAFTREQGWILTANLAAAAGVEARADHFQFDLDSEPRACTRPRSFRGSGSTGRVCCACRR